MKTTSNNNTPIVELSNDRKNEEKLSYDNADLTVEVVKSEDNPYVGYSVPVYGGEEQGYKFTNTSLFYDGKKIGYIVTSQCILPPSFDHVSVLHDIMWLLGTSIGKETFHIMVWTWDDIDGHKTESDKESVVFDTEDEAILFYEKNREEIEKNEKKLMLSILEQ